MRSLFFFAAAATLLACSGDDTTDTTQPGTDGGTHNDGNITTDSPGNPPDTGPVLCNGVVCGPNETCLGKSCGCLPGYVPASMGCDAAQAGSPAAHTKADVCARWASGHVVTTPNPFNAGMNMCDPGTLAAGGITDTLVRINMYRWLTGESDTTTDDPAADTGDQGCAVIAAWNPAGPQAHNPPMNSTCYNSLGATWAGKSNIAWGNSTSQSIDLYVEDPGNATTMGHRRWVLHPPLGKVGIGFYQGGNQYGQAQCLGVFDTSGSGPMPSWYAFPPPGFVPDAMAKWPWTFHTKSKGIDAATITMKELVSGEDRKVTIAVLNQGYGDDAISFMPNGWTPVAGEVIRVTVTYAAGTVVYDVSFVGC